MNKYFKSVLILFLGFISVEAFSQNAASRLSDAVKFTVKNCKKDCISMQLLKSATQITYGFNNGSVAPKYAYQGYIVVTLQNIALKISNQSSPCYSNYDITIKKELRTSSKELRTRMWLQPRDAMYSNRILNADMRNVYKIRL